MTLDKILKKYSIKTDKKTNKAEAFISYVKDLTTEFEAIWDFNSIRYDTIMTLNEWKKFKGHPERKPYKNKRGIKNLIQKENFVLELIGDTFSLYQKAKTKDAKETYKANLANLIDFYLNAKYDLLLLRFKDTYAGRTADQRDRGYIKPTPVTKALMDFSIKEYALINNEDEEHLHKEIYNICNGEWAILYDYYNTCDIDTTLRKKIYEIFKISSRDKTLSFLDIRIGYKIWKALFKIGIDIDKYLELNDFPKTQTINKKLLEFLSNKDFNKEILAHFKDDLPKTYDKYIKNKTIDSSEFIYEEAPRKKYPKKLKNDDEVKQMITECENEVYTYFPLAKKYKSPKYIILNPLNPNATSRAFQSSVKNNKGSRVNTIVMTPRSDNKDNYLSTLAHEVTHALHRVILEKGEKAKILKKGATELVPGGVLEDFSQLVEHQFYTDKILPYKKEFTGKEFPNFQTALGIRYQVPFALVQLLLRKDFEKLINANCENLSESHLWDLKYKYDALVKKWSTIGLNIDAKGMNSFSLFTSHDPLDGLVYMKRYLSNKKDKSQDKTLTMSQAFTQRFGKEWIKSHDARVLLFWLMLESGRNYNSNEYYKIVEFKDIKECLVELVRIGISSEEI